MKTIILLSVLCLPCLASLGPHPVDRTLMDETETAMLYRDKMTDGSYRDSQILKPAPVKPPQYPVRITLIGTNDLEAMWGLVYEGAFEGGRVETNTEYVIKTGRDRLKTALEIPEPPRAYTNDFSKENALDHAKQRRPILLSDTSTNKVMRMAKAEARVDGTLIDGDFIVMSMTDGTERRQPIKKAFTSRVSARPVTDITPPVGNRYGVKELAAFAAGVAATLAALGVKKAV